MAAAATAVPATAAEGSGGRRRRRGRRGKAAAAAAEGGGGGDGRQRRKEVEAVGTLVVCGEVGEVCCRCRWLLDLGACIHASPREASFFSDIARQFLNGSSGQQDTY